MRAAFLCAVVLVAGAPVRVEAATDALELLRRGHTAFRAGDYPAAVAALEGVGDRLPRSRDYVTYLLAESAFYTGKVGRARALFGELGRMKESRLAPLAPYRVADCLWAEGERAAAGAAYQRLLGASPTAGDKARGRGPGGPAAPLLPDRAVGRFHLAELAAEAATRAGAAGREKAWRAFRAVHVEFPAHPLGDEAGRRAAAFAPAATSATPAAAGPSPAERLARASLLTEGRHFQEAVDELEKLPADLPPPLRTERDFQLGMTKYHMRRDYGRAAALLLGAVDGLTGEKQASAAFHGTRALSRVDRDDEAIAGYRAFVVRFPRSRYAAEAQFRSGWLELNRGRFRESLPGMEETLARFPKSEFADDAAWFTALARVLLGEGDKALAALDRYERLAAHGKMAAEAALRVPYFRARVLFGQKREHEARMMWGELSRRAPFSYYGLMARARLRGLGQPTAPTLPPWEPVAVGNVERAPARPLVDPALERSDELAAAGLDVEAGIELARAESAFLGRVGRERGLPVLLERYARTQSFWRARQLAEVLGQAALNAAPAGPALPYWQAAYPRAYTELVEKYGPPAGNPELFLYSIMLKESAFSPVDVSYADARGLLQMLPATSTRVAAGLGEGFSDEQLYVPEVNVRLGASYIGSLARKFGSVPVAAGSFNAGPRAMARWCDQNGRRPLDEFIELVTYEQSREYIKRVLQIYARYKYLYRTEAWEPSLETTCHYDQGGPDF